jgi:hypothetical protein
MGLIRNLPIGPSILDKESNKYLKMTFFYETHEDDFEWGIRTGKKTPIYIEKYLYSSPFLYYLKKIDWASKKRNGNSIHVFVLEKLCLMSSYM